MRNEVPSTSITYVVHVSLNTKLSRFSHEYVEKARWGLGMRVANYSLG